MARRGPEAEEVRRVQNQRVASFFFALEHIGGFGGVADRLNAYNVYRGDPSLITADVQRFSDVLPGEDSRRRQTLSGSGAPRISSIGLGPQENQSSPRRSTAPSFLPARTRSAIGPRCRGS